MSFHEDEDEILLKHENEVYFHFKNLTTKIYYNNRQYLLITDSNPKILLILGSSIYFLSESLNNIILKTFCLEFYLFYFVDIFMNAMTNFKN